MHGIAPTCASEKRTASAVLFFLVISLWLVGGARALAQEVIYRCGQEYTNAPRDPSRCQRMSEQSVTVISGVRPRGVVPPAAVSSVQPFPVLAQPNPRHVLTQELARLEKQYQALEQEIVLLLSQTGTAEYGAAPKNQNRVAALQLDMVRTEREIEALQREWDRVSKTPMQAASPVGKP